MTQVTLLMSDDPTWNGVGRGLLVLAALWWALYFSHVALRIRVVYPIRRATTETPSWIGPGRLVTAIGMLVLLPVALELSALTALALVTGLCWALIAYDVVHYREGRIQVRQARP